MIMWLFLVLFHTLHHIGPACCAAGVGFLKSPLDGSPLGSAQSHWPAQNCRYDVVGYAETSKNEPGIDWLNQWLDIGADFDALTFRRLYPIDGIWADLWNAPSLQDTLDHRIVGFDAKVAGLLNVDSAAFRCPAQCKDFFAACPCVNTLMSPAR